MYIDCANGIHAWESRTVEPFRILVCCACGAIDTCGVPSEMLEAAIDIQEDLTRVK
jgi:hypothetical protein